MRHDGRIVRLAKNRGFGFIQSDADNREYFFHFSDVDGSRGEISRLVAVEFTPIAKLPAGGGVVLEAVS